MRRRLKFLSQITSTLDPALTIILLALSIQTKPIFKILHGGTDGFLLSKNERFGVIGEIFKLDIMSVVGHMGSYTK